MKLLQTFADEIKKLDSFDSERKESTNKYNRQKTAVKSLFVSILKEAGVPLESGIRVGTNLYKVAATESSEIKAKDWYALFKKKEITEEQFLSALSVSKTVAKNVIGADQVFYISEEVKGKTPDLRVEDTKPTNKLLVEIIKPSLKIKKRLLSKPMLKKAKRRIKIGE